MTDIPSLIVFGSLRIRPSAEELQELRRSLLQNSYLNPVNEAISTLSKLWETLLVNDPALGVLHGASAAEQLAA